MDASLLQISYLNGVLVGINAINDSYLWIDSPDCFFYKAEHIFGNHDINSTLMQANGKHRFLQTIATTTNVIGNKNDELEKSLLGLAKSDITKLIFVTSMPMAQVLGVDYRYFINNVKKETGKESIYYINAKSTIYNWLDGYSDLLSSLAKGIDLKGASVDMKKVSIIGNLFDRNEGDCIGNLEELKNIFEGLGLEVVSIWLDGGNYNDLLKVKESGTIISLPYGRKAAKILAKKLKINLLELDLPFGINKTINFIEEIGKHFKIENSLVKNFIYNELNIKNDISSIKWTINKVFVNKKITYYVDPYLFNGIIDFSEMLGTDINQIFIHGDEKHMSINNDDSYLLYKDRMFFGLNNSTPNKSDLYVINSANLYTWIIGGEYSDKLNSSYSRELLYKYKILNFGFPSYYNHYFTSRPYYGIKGSLNFISDMFNKLNS